MTRPDYNKCYFAANKASIMAKRAARRDAMTGERLALERQKARDRAKRSKENLRVVMAKLADALETLRPALIERERIDHE